MKFYSAYQFMPINRVSKQTDAVAYANIAEGESHIRHDCWKKGTLSGRINCEITLQSPTVVGAKQTRAHENAAAHVEPYRAILPPEGEPTLALPANSLRGMVSHVAETLSLSAMRVLTDDFYSVRKPTQKALKKIGLVVKEDDALGIKPLALTQSLNNTDAHKLFGHVPAKEYSTVSIPLDEKIKSFQKYQPENNTYWYRHQNGLSPLLNETQYQNLPTHKQQDYVRGVLYATGKHFDTKLHERFVPYPKSADNRKAIELPDSLLDRFEQMALEAFNDKKRDLHLPQGYDVNARGQSKRFVHEGDLVYFDVEDKNGQLVVSEISFSAIWRKPYYHGTTTHQFAKQAAQSEDIVPWNPDRNELTPAEALFGVVESDKGDDEGGSRNLAGRVRFSDALPNADIQQHESVKLSILSSPKPPSPRMYFTDANTQNGESNSEGPMIKGRKFYLHHTKEQLDKALAFWQKQADTKEENDNQRIICEPLAKDSVFQFHVDFDNLTAVELELLLVSLQPRLHPDYAALDPEKPGAFWHKLGLGKPLGLGSVLIRVWGICFTDRQQRYRTVTNIPRYTHAIKYDNKPCKRLAEARYAQEKAMLTNTHKNETLAREQFFPEGKSADTGDSLIDTEALKLLFALRHPDLLEKDVWVTYPVTKEQLEAVKEDGVNTKGEGFKWFDSKNDQRLEVIQSHRLGQLNVYD